MATSARVARLLNEAAAIRLKLARRRRWFLMSSGSLIGAAKICIGTAHAINHGEI
jgi:hypothetical protein